MDGTIIGRYLYEIPLPEIVQVHVSLAIVGLVGRVLVG